jgi:excisionase family DNA binding protein
MNGRDTAARELYRVVEVMALLSLSRSVLYEELSSGRLRSVHVGRTRLIPATAITEYVALLEREADAMRDVS